MSAKDTEQKLIRVIAEHYFEGGEDKLTIQIASDRAGISRQAFNRNYDHLKPYVLGKRPIEDLITDGIDDVRGLLSKSQVRMHELQHQIETLRAERDETIKKERESYITTLMNNDISLRNSDQVRDTLEKQSLHNEKLVKELHRLQLELTTTKAELYSHMTASRSGQLSDTNVVALETDLSDAFQHYAVHRSPDQFEDEKEKAVEQILRRLCKLCQNGDTAVIIFIERYVSSFSKYVKDFHAKRFGKTAIVSIPLFNRTEIKLFAGKLPKGTSVAVHIPFCASEAIIKAQRKFSFRGVPDIEFNAGDQMAYPMIQDGYSEVAVLRVEQGD